MKRLKCMKNTLIDIVQEQLSHSDCADTKELGQVIDMIKDLSESIYYCTVTEAMEDTHKEKNEHYEHEEEEYDSKEGKSHIARKAYLESKSTHMDTGDVKELQHYLQDLHYDLAEIIEQATPEEKLILQQRLTDIVKKI